jgi:pimeloyl-ACP methyl ester carboxylesterase
LTDQAISDNAGGYLARLEGTIMAGISRTYVLVHGANHGGWCYARVADLLRALGHRVFTPTLSGLAERAGDNVRSINLTTHINDILDLFKWQELEKVVLCGHSYGGMVTAGVADRIPDQIDHLVFLDAVVPENGKCMTDYVWPGAMLLEVMQIVGAYGGGSMLPVPPAAFFKVNEVDQPMVDRLLTPHPMASLLERIAIGDNAARIAQHSYIYAANFGLPALTEQYERAKSLPDWHTYEVEAGHDIMLDAPERLSEILSHLA